LELEGDKKVRFSKNLIKYYSNGYIPRLKEEYKNRVISALKEEYGYTNVMQVPKLEKIVLSRGVGAAVSDKKLIDYAVDELTDTGQKQYQFQRKMLHLSN
jgi:ribosomal protein L5